MAFRVRAMCVGCGMVRLVVLGSHSLLHDRQPTCALMPPPCKSKGFGSCGAVPI